MLDHILSLRIVRWATIAVLLISMLGAFSKGHAQTLTGNITATPTSGSAPLSLTLSWDVQGATAETVCTASGSWTGTKPVSGSQPITNLLTDATYSLSCTTPGKPAIPAQPDTVTLNWVPPTQNTDGSTLTNLAGYRVLYGTSSSALTQTVTIPNPAARSHQIDFTTAGPQFFAVRAFSTAGGESVNSNVVSVTTAPTPGTPSVAPQTWAKSVTVPVVEQPNPPTGLTVAGGATAYRQNTGSRDKISMARLGVIKPPSGQTRVPCDSNTQITLTDQRYNMVKTKYVRKDASAPSYILQAWAKCS